MEQHRTLSIDGRTIHYRDEGRENSKTLVLLHGFLQSLDVWSSSKECSTKPVSTSAS